MRFISLNRLLDSLSKSEILCLLRQFTSRKNDNLQDFIHNKAIDFEKRDQTRTFLFIENGKIQAFFSLTLKSLDARNLSNTTKKKLSPANSKDYDFIPCFLIGQLGKDDNATINGRDILNEAMFSLQIAHRLLGSKFVLVDAINHHKVIDFYERNGFKQLPKSENEDTIKMVRFF